METVERRGRSRRERGKDRGIKEKRSSHFRTVCFGGFDEGQVLCYLWDIVKALELELNAEAVSYTHLDVYKRQAI